MHNERAVAAHWNGGFDEAGLQSWAEQLREQLQTPHVSLGLAFLAPKFFPHAAQALEILRIHSRIPLLVGCSSASCFAGRRSSDTPAVPCCAASGSLSASIQSTETEPASGRGRPATIRKVVV